MASYIHCSLYNSNITVSLCARFMKAISFWKSTGQDHHRLDYEVLRLPGAGEPLVPWRPHLATTTTTSTTSTTTSTTTTTSTPSTPLILTLATLLLALALAQTLLHALPLTEALLKSLPMAESFHPLSRWGRRARYLPNPTIWGNRAQVYLMGLTETWWSNSSLSASTLRSSGTNNLWTLVRSHCSHSLGNQDYTRWNWQDSLGPDQWSWYWYEGAWCLIKVTRNFTRNKTYPGSHLTFGESLFEALQGLWYSMMMPGADVVRTVMVTRMMGKEYYYYTKTTGTWCLALMLPPPWWGWWGQWWWPRWLRSTNLVPGVDASAIVSSALSTHGGEVWRAEKCRTWGL